MIDYIEVDGGNSNLKELNCSNSNSLHSVVYLFNPKDKIYDFFKEEYQLDLENLLYEEEEVIHEISDTKTGKEELKILFILPHQNLKNDLNRKIKALVILKLEEKLIIVTSEKEDFISDFFKNTGENVERSEVNFIQLLNVSIQKVIKDVKEKREEISLLETQIQSSGPSGPIFNEILRLKKYLILLDFIIDSDRKILSFINREQKENIKEIYMQNEVTLLEERMDTLESLVRAYNKYLSSLDTVINNNSSFQLNNIMKMLTELTVVLTIPTITYGFWGINLKLPFQGVPYGSLLVIVISLLISVLVWYWLKKKKSL
ncbi:magnesium transporter CorA family protein [Lactococcus lactis subsp. lactis]|uniref:CorA family divalent cation transporter n=2 Tax=Lactococcus lactis TaxID=1358 RepID=UPI00071D9048|nr:CorA family divalent cation transporter [Lactococcus lactis]KST77577.1 putative 37-kDa protein [Lactococcus lactis subsp. lactis]MBR8680149.1 magnesium transporter CorA family protein [Lactococcus lactis subsp. lactis]MBR8682605.1 magnesium transporter CorA family protein [Lactococcus lactis subsp. lactis]MBR8688140.1 magnesium transporter CorA family protein [Lactococcus lactis subsp. lactis]MBS3731099.1 magnesium transporter CorA family protein [Lactococcus lactis subsp. lactis]